MESAITNLKSIIINVKINVIILRFFNINKC